MKFTSKRTPDPEASVDQSIKNLQDNSHEAVLDLGYNFKGAFSLIFSKTKADLAKASVGRNGSVPNLESSSNPLVTAAKSALKKCKYIAQKRSFASPQSLGKQKLI
eukprot:TRINITY_DN2778_c0_g1_i10.p3 TRINITY_DN2778_c0_g1~~TRINITY_DN2778_c0_g1_i10.p3  ORF type:complete len:106 (+),score=1.86 TRINITY_DN2778_c0_g1_i10:567-884(+)